MRHSVAEELVLLSHALLAEAEEARRQALSAPTVLPSPEALKMAMDFVRRRYILPETVDHSAVQAECLWLANLIVAFGLAPDGSRPPRSGRTT